uniref:Uncharacterized protein n=2 Tax=Caenorhabditis japonica TaxID=281687 RepID=A0A8R1HRJ1_CAEJA
MNQKLSPLLRRCFSLNLPSTSSASCIDYTFSENVLKNSLPKIERFCQYYVQNANSDAANVKQIPIVRFMSHGLQVDIQFGNIGPIRSTLFIRTCVEFDERVALLIHWLTAKFHNSWLLNSSARLFSRYHVNLLVIHFLQAMPYPVLPDVMRLSPWLNEKNDWNDSVKVLTRQGSLYVPNVSEFPNEQSVGQLVIQIIDYYSQIDFEKCAIDTRGRVLERNPKDLNELQLNDEYFEESTCRVQNAPHILKTFFSDLKATVEQEDFEKLFS